MSWVTDKSWSDRFIPEIKRIVGPHLLVPSSMEVDRSEAADLVILTARSLTIACRVRRHGYALDFGHQFTIRCQRDSGAKTELAKITEGWGDWMFYGHSNQTQDGFDLWNLIDLSSWRAHLIRDKGSVKKGTMSNGDGTHFAWFDIRSFVGEPELLISSSILYEQPF